MISASPTVTKVLGGQLCSGCGLCAGLAPDAFEMRARSPGYARPRAIGRVSSKAERAIAISCPGSIVAPWHDAPERDANWGPYHQITTGYARDPVTRHAGSSGGMVSALAMHALRQGLVQAVAHIVADNEMPTRNMLKWSTTEHEIRAGAGSRYAASSPLANIDIALSSGTRFAFIGKPCDVSALRQLATVDERVGRQVPIMLSFFCGGIPSYAGTGRIIDAMGLAIEDVAEFRYRGDGWPGLTRAVTNDGRVGEMRYADSWGRHLSKEVQFRCKICPDAVGGVADIACADAWYGGESGYPTFDEMDGRSLVITRTVVGADLLSSAVNVGTIQVEPLPVAEIALMQPAQARRKMLIASRLAACVLTLQPRPKMAGLDVALASRNTALMDRLKNMLGTMRRILVDQR